MDLTVARERTQRYNRFPLVLSWFPLKYVKRLCPNLVPCACIEKAGPAGYRHDARVGNQGNPRSPARPVRARHGWGEGPWGCRAACRPGPPFTDVGR